MTFRRPITPKAKPPTLLYLLFAFLVPGVVVFLIVWWSGGEVTIRNWPFCRRCGIRRWALTLTGITVTLVGGAVGFGALMMTSGDAGDGSGRGPIAIVLIGLFAGAVVTIFGSFTLVARAHLSRDGAYVSFTRPHPAFAAAIPPAAAAAPHQGSRPGAM